MAIGAVIRLSQLRRDGQHSAAQRREGDSRERRFHAYQTDAASRARPGRVGAARPGDLIDDSTTGQRLVGHGLSSQIR